MARKSRDMSEFKLNPIEGASHQRRCPIPIGQVSFVLDQTADPTN